ncbi:Uncharacterized protein FKW44_015326 [Caligus rogercresseyi]|uniref:Uncharacterized protein n=1 Tax=Caligus rogercresseyi TaxID=217165 RepID=A0A7T8H088_CALRO|nr:Uncharacterized protein FKW44_015326 [Caligus rogercresseyi]
MAMRRFPESLADLDHEVLVHAGPLLVDGSFQSGDVRVAKLAGLGLNVRLEGVVQGVAVKSLAQKSISCPRNACLALAVWAGAPSC